MPEHDNTPVEKIDLTGADFAEDLSGNNFGIEDTQLIAARDLQNFLSSDPDEVKNIEEEKKKAAEEEAKVKKQQEQQQESPEDKIKREAAERKAKDEKPDGQKALQDFLFKSEEENQEELDENGKPKATSTQKMAGENDGDDTYSTLSKDLLKLGVFSKNSDDETEETIKIDTPEEFLERFNLEKKKGAIGILDNFLSQFGEDYRKMFDAVFVNGVKPQEYLGSFAKIEAIKDMDMALENNQERVVKAYYKDLKWDDTKIDARIQKLKDYGDLEDEAKAYHEILLNKEKETVAAVERTKIEEMQKQKDKDATTLKSFQRILAEKLKTQEIDGIPLTQKDAEEVTDYLTTKKFKLNNGDLLSEFDKDLLELNRPENHETKIKLGLLLRKKLDLTSIKKTTISKRSDDLFTLSTKNAKQVKQQKQEIKSFF